MTQLPKPLATALKASKPDANKKLAENCYTASKNQINAAKMLTEAGKAFEANDVENALALLQHASDCLATKG